MSKMPAFTPSSALTLLWERASNKLEPHELDWFAENAAENIGLIANQDSVVMGEIASNIHDAKNMFRADSELSCLLSSVANNLDLIGTLAGIADDAVFLSRKALKAEINGGST